MSTQSNIEWTEATWNPVTGCDKISPGCKHCYAERLPWSPNIWMGVSIESPKYLYRADDLRLVPSVVRFLSLEPLLESLPGLDVTGIDWVIVGGESGPGCRPMEIGR